MALVAVLVFALLFQGTRGLWEQDEGRYTCVALQMLRSRDFLVPAYNDEVLHLTKPPLTYWSLAGGMTLLGRNEWGARLPNALAFAGTIFVLFGLGRRITSDRPWLPPLVYATSLLPFAAMNIVTTDTLLAFWETLAVWGFVEWWVREGRSRLAWLILAWASLGLAFLTKGPPGLLPLLSIGAFAAWERGWPGLKGAFHPIGLMVFVTIGASWYLAVEAGRPGTLSYWLRDEVVARVTSDLYHRNPQWYKAFTIYGPVLVLGCVPWLLPAARGIVRSARNAFLKKGVGERGFRDPWSRFLGLWFSLPLLVFLVSSSRLQLYVLPLMAPAALAIARWVRLPFRRHLELPLLAAWIVVLLAVKYVAGAVVSSHRDSRALAQAVIASVEPPPQEILFVDTRTYWGLSMYLGVEVEQIETDPRMVEMKEGSESFRDEMASDEPGRLMIVDHTQVDRILEACRANGFEAQMVGGYHGWRFLSLPPRK